MGSTFLETEEAEAESVELFGNDEYESAEEAKDKGYDLDVGGDHVPAECFNEEEEGSTRANQR